MRIDGVMLSVGDGPGLGRKLDRGFGDNNRRGGEDRCLLRAETWLAHGSISSEQGAQADSPSALKSDRSD